MTIIAILTAFALCHFIRELGQIRRFEWLKPVTSYCNERCKNIPGWSGFTGFLFYLGVPLLLVWLANTVMTDALGNLGGFILSLIVLIYTFGPHDLDSDIDDIIHARDDEAQAEALGAMLGKPVPTEADACEEIAVEAVFREAMQRWFGTIFWFAVLGVYGAVMYRIADRITEDDLNLPEEQNAMFMRLRDILDWPVAQLMTLALAIATDFDSVYRAWKTYHDELGQSLFAAGNGFLYASVREVVLSGHAARDGYADQLDGPMACIKQTMDLVWRVLGVWMTVLAILLLVDVIA